MTAHLKNRLCNPGRTQQATGPAWDAMQAQPKWQRRKVADIACRRHSDMHGLVTDTSCLPVRTSCPGNTSEHGCRQQAAQE